MTQKSFDARLSKLLDTWSSVEASVKHAELLSQNVVIPAINELRYAGRQLLIAFVELRKDTSSDEEVEKAVNNAEQYLINADNDVVDAIVLFIGQRIDELNFRYGKAAITARFSDYARLCDLKAECYSLVEESRRSWSKRKTNYSEMKANHIPGITSLYTKLVETDVLMALEFQSTTERLKYAKARSSSYLFAAILLFIGLLSSWAYFFTHRR